MRRLNLLISLFFLFLSAARVGGQESGREITVTADNLATAIIRASDGDIINVSGGTYYGSLEIDKPLTINGIDWPVIDGQGSGTVLKLSAPGAIVRGLVIRNSGSSLDQENAGIAVEAADITIENNRLEETLFGIYLRDANGSIVRNNHVTSKELDVPRRGDPIRVWYSTDVLIEDNVVERGRDVVLWYSERLTVRGNEVTDGRYGLHFMYCDDALIEQNLLLNNSVGTFLMYSRRMTMQHNTIGNNRGPSGYGVGLKDMDDAVVKENLFLNNRIGAHVDGSPREVDSTGRFEGNVFAYNDIGVNMLPAVRHNEFLGNSFVDNEEQVAVAGGGQLRENDWTVGDQGNYWSDYAGYDVNGDGQGEIEYKSERLFENLMSREPNLRLFLYSPAINAIDLSAKAFPIVKPQPKLTDTKPLMAPIIPQDAPPLPQPTAVDWLIPALVAIVLALVLAGLPRFGRHHFRSLSILEKTQ
mgnify:FL=1